MSLVVEKLILSLWYSQCGKADSRKCDILAWEESSRE